MTPYEIIRQLLLYLAERFILIQDLFVGVELCHSVFNSYKSYLAALNYIYRSVKLDLYSIILSGFHCFIYYFSYTFFQP